MLLVTHSLTEAEEVCDRLAILHQGKVAALGTVEEVRHWQGSTDLAGAFKQALESARLLPRDHFFMESVGVLSAATCRPSSVTSSSFCGFQIARTCFVAVAGAYYFPLARVMGKTSLGGYDPFRFHPHRNGRERIYDDVARLLRPCDSRRSAFGHAQDGALDPDFPA